MEETFFKIFLHVEELPGHYHQDSSTSPLGLDPAIDGPLFGGSLDHGAIVALQVHQTLRNQARHQAAVVAANQSTQLGPLPCRI